VILPDADGWQFFGPQQGGPQVVNGVTADASGNVWVAGGEEGLFLLRAGSNQFVHFTMNDGLHPYGFLPDGSVPPRKYLNVISVAGGPANTVFVGYMGMTPPAGQLGCEDNWDGPSPDPSIYKSGDADKVTLNGNGISVVHYDIFSGPGVVADELRGREKLCNIYRIAYDASTHSVWFGGNHGFAWGDANFSGDPTCNGQLACSGVQEHAHPAINGCLDEPCSDIILLTDGYYGLSVDKNSDLWVGGEIRSTHFRYHSNGDDFWSSESQTEQTANHIDIWPDVVTEPQLPTPSQRVDDDVSSMAAMSDGTVWVGSFDRGLAHLNAGGGVAGYLTSGLVDPTHVNSLLADTDGSLWVGAAWGGISRLNSGQIIQYSNNVFGDDLIQGPVIDLQMDHSGSHRRILAGFQSSGSGPGAIGIYSGN
jgi:hypothetical protein